LRREQITSVTSGAVALETLQEEALSDRAQVHFRVVRAIAQNPTLSQRDLARALGISLGGVNYCIKALIDKGAVKVENFRASDSKMRYAYVLTPDGLTEKARMTGRFLQRKMREYEVLKAEIDALTETTMT
jgi:EPS-associated MarR family transcriptional regulator